jgi:hypothetical protein
MSPGISAPSARAVPAARLLAANLAACLLLLIQYLLGMVANLYVTVPDHHPGSGARSYFTGVTSGLAWVIPDGPGWVAAHSALGLALVLAAFAVLALSWKRGSRLATGLAALGAAAILGAGFNGASFLNYGHDFSSMIMAALWALALASYLTGLYLGSRGQGAGDR